MARNITEQNLIWLSYFTEEYSRSGAIRASLTKEMQGKYVQIPSGVLNSLKAIRNVSNAYPAAIFIVMSPSHLLVILTKLLSPKRRIVLDAGWTLVEAQMARSNKWNFEFFSNLIIDHLSFRLADHVFLESLQQEQFCQHRFGISKNKTDVIYSIVNQKLFNPVASVRPIEVPEKNRKKFIFFRGSFTLEAGLDKILQLISKSTIGSNFSLVIATNRDFQEVFPNVKLNPNVIWINRWLSYGEISWLYQTSSLILGQMNCTSRTENTLPHKLFEAAYFAKPYMTPTHRPVQTFFGSPDYYVDFSSIDNWEGKLGVILQNEEKLFMIGTRAHERYLEKCDGPVISKTFERVIGKLLSGKQS
jgi:hypothetical protein